MLAKQCQIYPFLLIMNPLSGGIKRFSPETKSPTNERSAKRTLQTTLETVHNDLNDATHARLDKLVLEEHPELVDKLGEAWNGRSFKQIRNISAITAFSRQN